MLLKRVMYSTVLRKLKNIKEIKNVPWIYLPDLNNINTAGIS